MSTAGSFHMEVTNTTLKGTDFHHLEPPEQQQQQQKLKYLSKYS
jgi:hypothetical protein